jgi:hypothetical protein
MQRTGSRKPEEILKNFGTSSPVSTLENCRFLQMQFAGSTLQSGKAAVQKDLQRAPARGASKSTIPVPLSSSFCEEKRR